jgi:hypothetical protein
MIERRNISVTAMVFYKRKKYIEICILRENGDQNEL